MGTADVEVAAGGVAAAAAMPAGLAAGPGKAFEAMPRAGPQAAVAL